MKNRGPDQNGIFNDRDIYLAHNRLAIIDPENGAQPMTREHGGISYTIVYNGEIYNTKEIKRERADRMKALGTELSKNHNTNLIGKVVPVLFERENSTDFHQGHAPDYTIIKIF